MEVGSYEAYVLEEWVERHVRDPGILGIGIAAAVVAAVVSAAEVPADVVKVADEGMAGVVFRTGNSGDV